MSPVSYRFHIFQLIPMRKLLSHAIFVYINLMILLRSRSIHTYTQIHSACDENLCVLYVSTQENFTDCRHLIGLLIYTTSRKKKQKIKKVERGIYSWHI